MDRKNPRYVYGGCYQGIFEEMDMETGLTRQIMAWPALALTEPTNEIKYRFNWTSPAVVSQHDPNVIYHGGNVLFRTADRGKTWAPISPDLTRNDKATQGWGGTPFTNEGAGGEVYGTIVTIAESPHDANTIYVGTDDGLVQLTRDGGKTWTNVTPAGVPVGSRERGRGLAARCRHGVPRVPARSAWRLYAVRVQVDRLRKDVDAHREGAARGGAGARRARGSR